LLQQQLLRCLGGLRGVSSYEGRLELFQGVFQALSDDPEGFQSHVGRPQELAVDVHDQLDVALDVGLIADGDRGPVEGIVDSVGMVVVFVEEAADPEQRSCGCAIDLHPVDFGDTWVETDEPFVFVDELDLHERSGRLVSLGGEI